MNNPYALSPLKQLALAGWYCGSWPYRRWSNWQAARQGAAPVSVLFYHRVSDHGANAWTIPQRTFAAHVRYLQRNFDLISLAEAQARMEAGRNDRPAVCLTFDDGYAENCEFALPLLIHEGIPCTYFVTLGHIVSGAPFPHDVAAGTPAPPNRISELQDLAAAGIEIGAHTRTHANLGAITDPAALFDETVAASEGIANVIGRPVRYFAFPYGLPQHLNALAVQYLREAGYVGVCTAYGDYNWPGDDPFHIKRIHADAELLRLRNWLTVDPRKRRAGRQMTTRVQPLFEIQAQLTDPLLHETCV